MVFAAFASIVISPQKDFATAEMLVKASDTFYQGQFANLKLAQMGKFGVSRIESSQIKTHSNLSVDPAVRSKTWMSSVQIFGSHGKPLDVRMLSRRYYRSPTTLAAIKPKSVPNFASDAILADAIRRFSLPNTKPVVMRRDSFYSEIRPVRLSKPECLKCHTDMKLGDPVALMVYVVSRKKQARPPGQ
ncbi:MAG: hypothetical protein K1X67_16685 [Fimbriimonadaceae bacterium]|nr:hypothetical protein [Fimbriimonadaceae bacterium]